MKRRSTKTVYQSADKRKCSRRTTVSTTRSTAVTTRPTTTTITTFPAASSADVTVPAAGIARQRRFTAKRALEMLQNLPDTDSGSDDSETNDEHSDSSCLLYTSPSPRD